MSAASATRREERWAASGREREVVLFHWMQFVHRIAAQLICPSGGLLTGLSSLISGFPKNISVPT
jgi:hypothetical protein